MGESARVGYDVEQETFRAAPVRMERHTERFRRLRRERTQRRCDMIVDAFECPAMNVMPCEFAPGLRRLFRDAPAAYMLIASAVVRRIRTGGAMTIEERAIGSVVVLDMSGRLVLGDGDQLLKERVSLHLEQGNRQVVLNVGKLSYVDSSGLGVIVGSSLAARHQGGALRLINPSSRLQQLLAMAKLLTVVDVCQSEEEAVGSFASPR